MHGLRTACGCCIIAFLTVMSCRVAPEKRTDSIPAESVDLERYLGKWYEIARFPHRFEKDLVGVTATYSLRPDGKIEVLNEGFKDTLQEEKKQAKGSAWIPDPEMPGLLKVSFFMFFAADYRVIALDRENYEWAMVTSSSKDYFWILCRKPEMDGAVYNMLLDKARGFGFDLSKLEKVPQHAMRSQRGNRRKDDERIEIQPYFFIGSGLHGFFSGLFRFSPQAPVPSSGQSALFPL